jgi:hypothetical protein
MFNLQEKFISFLDQSLQITENGGLNLYDSEQS